MKTSYYWQYVITPRSAVTSKSVNLGRIIHLTKLALTGYYNVEQ